MRGRGGRHGGDYGGARRPYGGVTAQMHQQHRQSIKYGYYHGRHQEQLPVGEKDGVLDNNQWRREGDDPLPLTAMSPTALCSEGQGSEMPKSNYKSPRLDSQVALEREGGGGGDPRSKAHEEDMGIGYEDMDVVQTYEALERDFLNDIIKLSKEHTSAEDAENARHRERLNTINEYYEKQLAAIRSQHASRREEFLQRESQARQQQYQQMLMEIIPLGALVAAILRVSMPGQRLVGNYTAEHIFPTPMTLTGKEVDFLVRQETMDMDRKLHIQGAVLIITPDCAISNSILSGA